MRVLDEMNAAAEGLGEWRMEGFDGWRLTLVADVDLSYHHRLEVVFEGVSYLECPCDFHDARFRPGTADERAALRARVALDDGDHVFVVEAGTSALAEPGRFYVVAEGVAFRTGTVLHYDPERRPHG